MSKIKLLIVEDDTSLQENYKRIIQGIDRDPQKPSFEVDYKPDLKSSMGALKSSDFDAAIIDLKLAGENGNTDGIEIINEVKSKLRFPVFIVSAFIDLADDFTSPFIMAYKKADPDVETEEIFEKIIELYNTGITRILNHNGIVDEFLNKVFWDHLSGSLDYWLKSGLSGKQSEKILSRFIISRLVEYLGIDETGKFEPFHPAEVLIKPVIKSNFHTGMIIEKDGNRFIILTPACDMIKRGENRNAEVVLLAEIEPIPVEDLSQVENIGKKAMDILKQSNKAYLYCLPPYSNFHGGIINFRKISTINVGDLNGSYLKLAEVIPLFFNEIKYKFVSYYSRIGQPEFDFEKVFDCLKKEFENRS